MKIINFPSKIKEFVHEFSRIVFEKKAIIFVLVVLFFELFSPQHLSSAAEGVIVNNRNLTIEKQKTLLELEIKNPSVENEMGVNNLLKKQVIKIIFVTVTAYTSTRAQTDRTPYITATGTHVRSGVAAANFLPIGTRIILPDVFGEQEFIVEDRMNRRYQKRIDIWMNDFKQAKIFGKKYLKVEVLE